MYRFSKEESDRIRIIKFIAIIFVVYIHSYATEISFSDGTNTFYLPIWLRLLEDGLSQVVARCGVPVFFLISSILLFRTDNSYIAVIRKKTRTLLLPYLIWNTFWIAVFIILQALPFTAAYFSGKNTPILQSSFVEWLGLYGIATDYPSYPHCYPLWFMRDLMVVLLFFPVIKVLADKYPKILLGAGVLLTFIPWNFLGKTALAWFVIGAVIVKMQIHMETLDKIPFSIVGIVYLAGMVVSLLSDISMVRNAFIYVGIVFWIRVSKEIYHRENIRSKLLWLSKWTFVIYVFHEMTLTSAKKMCMRLFPTTPVFLLVEYAFLPVCVIVGCIVAGNIFIKICPKLYMVSVGER